MNPFTYKEHKIQIFKMPQNPSLFTVYVNDREFSRGWMTIKIAVSNTKQRIDAEEGK